MLIIIPPMQFVAINISYMLWLYNFIAICILYLIFCDYYFLFISKFQIQWLVTMLDSAGFMEPLFNIGVFILWHSDISMNDFSYTTLFISVRRMKLRIFTCGSQCLRFYSVSRQGICLIFHNSLTSSYFYNSTHVKNNVL